MESLKITLEGFVESYGYLGIFLIAFTESIIQPVPPDPFISGATAMGLNPLLSAIVATFGSVSGGVVAYFLGKFLGEPVAKRLLGEERFLKAEAFYNRYGTFAVIIAGLTPVPYKVFCWLSGILEFELWRFVIASVIGRFPRFLLFALFGEAVGNFL
ncbi:YqaA family protein [Aquifex pyrophilus]